MIGTDTRITKKLYNVNVINLSFTNSSALTYIFLLPSSGFSNCSSSVHIYLIVSVELSIEHVHDFKSVILYAF